MKLLTALCLFVSTSASHAQMASQSPPNSLRYEVTVGPDGQLSIKDPDGKGIETLPLAEGDDDDSSMIGVSDTLAGTTDAWIVLDSEGDPKAVGPAGSNMLITKLDQGDSLQVVKGGFSEGEMGAGYVEAGWFATPITIEEMQTKIDEQVDAAIIAVFGRACAHNAKTIKITVSVGASAVVNANAEFEGTFDPKEVC